jgi:hypothetical protein
VKGGEGKKKKNGRMEGRFDDSELLCRFGYSEDKARELLPSFEVPSLFLLLLFYTFLNIPFLSSQVNTFLTPLFTFMLDFIPASILIIVLVLFMLAAEVTSSPFFFPLHDFISF